MCMLGDDEPWTLYHEVMRRAAKDHRCGECRRPIHRGETHQYVTGLYDGHWSTYRTCAHCVQVQRWLLVACEGWLFQMVQEDLFNHITGEESYVRTSALTRLGRWMQADWVDRYGNLRSIESVTEVTDRAIALYLAQEEARAG